MDGSYAGTEFYFNPVSEAVETQAVQGIAWDSTYSRPTNENLKAEFQADQTVTCFKHNGEGGIRTVTGIPLDTYHQTEPKITYTIGHADVGGKGSIHIWNSYENESGQGFTLKKLPEGTWVADTNPYAEREYTFSGIAPGSYRVTTATGINGSVPVNVDFTVLEMNQVEEEEEVSVDVNYAPFNTIYLSQNPIKLSFFASAPGKTVMAQLYMESEYGKADFTKVGEFERDAEADQLSYFDFAETINTRLEVQLPANPSLEYVPQIQLKNLRRFYLRLTEKAEDSTAVAWHKTNTATAMYGGIPGHLSTEVFFSFLTANRKFLTWQPSRKTIYEGQPEILYFLFQDSSLQECSLNIEYIAFDPATPIFSEKKTIYLEPGEFRLYSMTIPGEGWPDQATQIRATLVDAAGNAISEIRIYDLEHDQEQARSFVFRNSLGTFDVLQATGDRTDTLELDQELAEYQNGEQFTFHLQARRNFKVSTGFKTRPYLEYLQEFMLSKKKAEVIQGRFQAITLSTKKIDYRADFQGPQGFTFEYAHSTTSNHYATL